MIPDLHSTNILYRNLVRQPIVDGLMGEGEGSIRQALQTILAALVHEDEPMPELVDLIFNKIKGIASENVAAIEINKLLKARMDIEWLDSQLDERAKKISCDISPHLRGYSILDFGGGDGRVLFHLTPEIFKTTVLYDIADYRAEETLNCHDIEFCNSWDQLMKFMGGFDTAIIITTLHHAEDPHYEMARLTETARRLIVVESIISPYIPLHTQAFADWFCNRCIRPSGNVPVPGNWKTVYAWREFFKRHGLHIALEKDLGIDQPIVPEHHWMFVLDKKQ